MNKTKETLKLKKKKSKAMKVKQNNKLHL